MLAAAAPPPGSASKAPARAKASLRGGGMASSLDLCWADRRGRGVGPVRQARGPTFGKLIVQPMAARAGCQEA